MCTFCASIDEGLQTLRLFWVYHVDEGCIDPATGFDGIEATDDKVELHVILFVLVLDLSEVSMGA